MVNDNFVPETKYDNWTYINQMHSPDTAKNPTSANHISNAANSPKLRPDSSSPEIARNEAENVNQLPTLKPPMDKFTTYQSEVFEKGKPEKFVNSDRESPGLEVEYLKDVSNVVICLNQVKNSSIKEELYNRLLADQKPQGSFPVWKRTERKQRSKSLPRPTTHMRKKEPPIVTEALGQGNDKREMPFIVGQVFGS
jgi:hypothetical protein